MARMTAEQHAARETVEHAPRPPRFMGPPVPAPNTNPRGYGPRSGGMPLHEHAQRIVQQHFPDPSSARSGPAIGGGGAGTASVHPVEHDASYHAAMTPAPAAPMTPAPAAPKER